MLLGSSTQSLADGSTGAIPVWQGWSFEPSLEARFLADKALDRMRLIRRGSALAVLFALGLVITDAFLVPDRLAMSLLLKLLVFVPVCVGGQWIADRFFTPWLREWAVALAGLVAAVICVFVLAPSQSTYALECIVVLNVVVVFVNAIGRFWPCLVMSALIVLTHVATLLWMQRLMDVVAISCTLLLLSTVVCTLYATWVLEREERRAYVLDLQEQALSQELTASHELVARTARTDALTQVANRRHFDEVIAQVWTHAQTQRSSVALLLMDVDHFKAYNDLYGHPAGDACLQSVAHALSTCMRKGGDLVARWGGEEFAVIMSGATMESALLLAERVREAVMAQALKHEASKCATVVTVSIGVSAMDPGPESSLSELVRMADSCLYEAKARGRNRVWGRLADPLAAPEGVAAWA
jgi:diguanylate cyclase (GGDEF)-like protein